jgi:hypothetical protein
MKPNFRESRIRQLLGLLVLGLACAVSVAQVPEAPVLTSIDGKAVPPPSTSPPPDSGSSSDIPLSWDDSLFANAKTSSAATSLGSGSSRSDFTVTDSSGNPGVTCNGSCTLTRGRVRAREGYRCQSGTQNLNYMYFEITGTGDDHADGVQCYAPGSSGVVTVKNTTFKLAGAMNAGYWSADGWKGSHVFENVVFWGGNYGLRIPADGGTSVKLKNVYFVKDSFRYNAFLFDTVNGKRISIDQWDNVRWATIQNGKLVLGDAIPRP